MRILLIAVASEWHAFRPNVTSMPHAQLSTCARFAPRPVVPGENLRSPAWSARHKGRGVDHRSDLHVNVASKEAQICRRWWSTNANYGELALVDGNLQSAESRSTPTYPASSTLERLYNRRSANRALVTSPMSTWSLPVREAKNAP